MKEALVKVFAIAIVLGVVFIIDCKKSNNPPDPPETPSGISNGRINISYDFITSAIDTDGDSISYQIDWGDGSQSVWSDFKLNGTTITMSKSWSQAGTYLVKAIAKDTKEQLSDWSEGYTVTIFTNRIPNIPSIPNGPATGSVNLLYNFTTVTTDPDGDSVSYQFDWGNNDTSNWSAFRLGNNSITMSHAWIDSGTYSVRVRAKDTEGATSDWSLGHSITIVITANHTPNIPSVPNGVSSGYINTLYNFTTSTTDPDEDSVSYQFDWGDGTQSDWSLYQPSGTSILVSKQWFQAGVYLVKARAKDVEQAISAWSDGHSITVIGNNPPDIPSVPSDPSFGYTESLYNFTTSTTDPENDSIAYQFDWGDGTQSSWSAFQPSGISITMSKSWTQTADYSIRARAKDIKGFISDWSAGHIITITSNYTPSVPSTPSGPSSGYTDTLYNFTTSATDPNEDSISYQFDWGNGILSNWSSFRPSGSPIIMYYAWTDSGSYNVKARAKDSHGAISGWSNGHNIRIVIIINHEPNTPSTPSGPVYGLINIMYSFSTATTDPDDDSISYQFDWGNGVFSHWTDFRPSGSPIVLSQAYSDTGTFLIRARAKDRFEATSNWSDPHTIVITTIDTAYPRRVVDTILVGDGPLGLSSLPNGNYIYYTNKNSDNVSVIRTSDNTVVATIPVGDGPHSPQVLPNGNYVYVTNRYSNNVYVIRTSDNAIITSIAVGHWPVAITVTPDGNYIYTANWETNNVSIIQTSSNTVVATIPVGVGPQGICVLPNGNYIYVSNLGSNSVSVIRTSDHIVVATIPVGAGPRGIVAEPNGNYVYCANETGNSMSVIRTSDNTVISTFTVPGGPSCLCVLPGGQYIYVSQVNSTTVAVIRTSDNTVVATIPAGQTPSGIEPLPNGNFLYEANFNSNNVIEIGR